MDYLESKIKDLESTPTYWDNDDNSPDLLEDTPVILTPATKKINGKEKIQMYLRSSLKNNNLFRIPIPLQESKEQALIETYNFLSDILDEISNTLDTE